MSVHKNKKTEPIINRLDVRVPTRSTSDVSRWRSALRSADYGRMTTLYDLYEDLQIDGVLADARDKRILAVTNSELVFLDNSGKEVDDVSDLIDTPAFAEILTIIMKRRFWGRSGFELTVTEGGIEVDELPVKHINLDKEIIVINQNDETGIDYTTNDKLLVFGQKRDFGLFLKTAPYAIYKRGGFGDYAQWLEIFGMPQRLGKYNSQDLQSKAQLEEAFKNAGSAPWLVVPKETEVETVNNTGNNGGGGTSYNEFRKACNEEILITILGQTLTTIQGDKGARSLGEVHKNVEEDKNRDDLRFMQRMLNTVVLPVLQARGVCPDGKFVFPKAAKEATVDEIVKLSGIIKIPSKWVHEKYGIPEPDGDEPVAGAKPKEPEPPQDPPKPKKEKVDNSDPKNPPPLGEKEGANFFMQLYDFFADAPTPMGARQQKSSTTSWRERITGKIQLSDDGYKINVSKLFNQALKEIYAGGGDAINPKLFEITNSALQQAFDVTFEEAGIDFGKTNAAFIEQFRTNGAVFAAFKNHHQQKEIISLLTDEKGKLRPFNQFKKEALKVGGKYNVEWLKTEYNTAVRSARSAVNFKKYQENADLYPNLEYMESTSSYKRESHLAYVGTVLPIDDPWWDIHLPPSDWNCGCWVKQTDKEPTERPSDELVDPVFANNPGKTGEFLKLEEHPYIKNCTKAEQKLITQQAGSLYKKYQWEYINKWRQSIDPYKGKRVKASALASGKMTILRKSVKEIFSHSTDPLVRKYSILLESDVVNWKYLGWAKVDAGKHTEARLFTYYETKIAGQSKYVNVELHDSFGEVPYAIYDSIDLTRMNKGLPPGI